MASSQPAGNLVPERRDYRKEVTESIIQMLEQGVAPWQKPWDAATVGNLAVPFNPTSNNPYRGGNAIYLMASAILKGFDDPRWMTYKQAAANDWQVRGGEKGTQIEFSNRTRHATFATGESPWAEDALRGAPVEIGRTHSRSISTATDRWRSGTEIIKWYFFLISRVTPSRPFRGPFSITTPEPTANCGHGCKWRPDRITAWIASTSLSEIATGILPMPTIETTPGVMMIGSRN